MKNKRLLIAVGLVLLPLVDSLFIPQAFAIQWHSPEFMYLVSVALLAIKFVMVLVGGWLLLAKDLSSEPSKALRLTRFGTFLLAGLQLVIMSAILLWYAVAGTQAKHFQQVIKHSDQKGEHIKEIDLTGYQCGK